MRIQIDGHVNHSFAEMLCLLFYPGSKFPEDPVDSLDGREVYISSGIEEDRAFSSVLLRDGDREAREENVLSVSDYPTPEKAESASVGMSFFACGQRLTGKRPPWGIMTGVRPAKKATEYLKAGLSREQVTNLLQKDFLVLPEKASLLTDVAFLEDSLSQGKRDLCSLYVSIPF